MGGVTSRCGEVAVAAYSALVERVVPVSSARAAESAKLLENIYRCVNIAMINELKLLFERMGIDVWEVIQASATKPFGFTPFYPGPGLGGHCIPVDPFYLTWKAKQYDFNTRFIELAGEINSAMPHHVVDRLTEGLNLMGRALKGARILLIGAAYKRNVEDVRESPAIRIIQLLHERLAEVSYYDPYVPRLETRHLAQALTSIRTFSGNDSIKRCGGNRHRSRQYRLQNDPGSRAAGGRHAQRDGALPHPFAQGDNGVDSPRLKVLQRIEGRGVARSASDPHPTLYSLTRERVGVWVNALRAMHGEANLQAAVSRKCDRLIE